MSDKIIHRKFFSPIYSEELHSVFGSESSCEGQLVIEFSEPYKGILRCDILPKNRKVGIFGCPQITAFQFRYNDKGEIIRFSKGIVNVD